MQIQIKCQWTYQPELSDEAVMKVAGQVDLDSVADWPHFATGGDRFGWLLATKKERWSSFIQSLYWEFGSGVVVPEYGLVWNNRGSVSP